MLTAVLVLAVGNLGFAGWSHRNLGAAITATQASIVSLVSGRVREVGPVEAQTQALQKQAVERATARRTRPAALNL